MLTESSIGGLALQEGGVLQNTNVPENYLPIYLLRILAERENPKCFSVLLSSFPLLRLPQDLGLQEK